MAESTSRRTVVVTGAFGNVGVSTVAALLSRGHHVVAFDLPTLPHRAAAVRLRGRGVETVWGDVTDSTAVAAVVDRADAVVHLAALIPPHSDRRPELLHGLVIWKQPWLRTGAVLVAAGIAVMTVRMVRTGTFSRRLNIEVRDDQGQGRTFFTVTANGREAPSHITLQYGDGARHLQTTGGEISAFSSLRHAIFEPIFADGACRTPREVKIWVHRVTPEGDSEAISGSMTVQTGAATKRLTSS